MADTTDKTEDQKKWLIETLPQHERLSAAVKSLLENMLKKKKIEYLGVTARVKTADGVIEKIRRKEYNDPEGQLTDISGIRVITYLEEQVSQISKLIKELFEVDNQNSRDRAEVLGDDKVGYRSTHFVCSLGKMRDRLPEYEALGELKFEIQVRTVLQHAWAELAHDRSFKFGIALPVKIQRKLNLYSGLLEITDSAFDEISKEIDAYKSYIQNQEVTQISNVEVNSISLDKFLSELATELGIKIEGAVSSDGYGELQRFGVRTIGDLKEKVTPEFVKHFSSAPMIPATATSLVRRIMMHHDINRFFSIQPAIKGITPVAFEFLKNKYGQKHIENALKAAGQHVTASSKPPQSTPVQALPNPKLSGR
jgi:putative GTP pyrophosphokinase